MDENGFENNINNENEIKIDSIENTNDAENNENVVQDENFSNDTVNDTVKEAIVISQPPVNNSSQDETARAPVYYTENFKKPKEKKNSVFQLILIAVLSSILGGGVVFAAFQFVAPAISPEFSGYIGKTASNTVLSSTSANNGVYKKVEITQSDSPVTAIAEKVGPAIVGIKVTMNAQGQNFFFDVGQGVGEGSGIIFRQDGYILTNNHVIEGALSGSTNKLTEGSKIEVILPSLKDKTYTATIIGRDSKTDIAVLKIDATGLPTAELGDSDSLKTGELAVAIGNPGGFDYMGSVTAGIISGLNRQLTTENGQTMTLIQTDAAINPGNSGGALCNSQGQVIGMNTVKISATGFEGLGFAIPINQIKEIEQSLMGNGYVKGRPSIGVSIRTDFTEDLANQYKVPVGLLVGDVTPLSAAYKAGIKSNDIITKFDGVTVKVFSDLQNQKNKHKPGDKVTVVVYRPDETGQSGKTLTLTLTLDEDKTGN